eukprot:12034596-Karenia_brevis.AAC.1
MVMMMMVMVMMVMVVWERHLVHVFGENWMQLAVTEQWHDRQSQYVDGAYAMLSMKPLEARFVTCKNKMSSSNRQCGMKKPRLVAWEPQMWKESQHESHLE